jgi:hypothetical protein
LEVSTTAIIVPSMMELKSSLKFLKIRMSGMQILKWPLKVKISSGVKLQKSVQKGSIKSFLKVMEYPRSLK